MGDRRDLGLVATAAGGMIALAWLTAAPPSPPAPPAPLPPLPPAPPIGSLVTFAVQGQGRLRAQLGEGRTPPVGSLVTATPGVPASLINDGSTIWLTPLPATGWLFQRYLLSPDGSYRITAVFTPA